MLPDTSFGGGEVPFGPGITINHGLVDKLRQPDLARFMDPRVYWIVSISKGYPLSVLSACPDQRYLDPQSIVCGLFYKVKKLIFPLSVLDSMGMKTS